MKIDFFINKIAEGEDLDIHKVYGFFQVTLGDNIYGYCPKEQIPELEGSELLSTWFEQFAEAYHLIKKTDYVLINDIDSFNSWIEIRRNDESLLEISHIISTSKQGRGIISQEPLESFEYGHWKSVCIDQRVFSQEIRNSTNKFLEEIVTIDPGYSNAEWVKAISEIVTK